MPLILVDNFDNFQAVRDVPPEIVTDELRLAVRSLDEREELEPFIRRILFDAGETPHGPMEIADILTHRATVAGQRGVAAFILKGKSFPTVRLAHVAHQILRLDRIEGLKFAILGTPGVVLDDVKEHFLSVAGRLHADYAFLDAVDLARLFIAYGFLCPRDARHIVAGRCSCGYSPHKRILNVLQNEALKALRGAHNAGQKAGLIVLPPGSGKTRIAAEDARAIGANRILYVAHTHEILDVAQSEFRAVLGADNVAWHRDLGDFFDLRRANLATIQLLRHHQERLRLDQFDYLVIDEFHHAAARSYRYILDRSQPDFLLGLTATPFRGDRQDILALCANNKLVEFELRSGIETGILSPYHYHGCFDNIDYSNIRYGGQRYDIRDLERALVIPQRDTAIIDKWQALAEGKPTLAFCCSQRHAERMAHSFSDRRFGSEVYLSFIPLEVRKRLVNRLRRGDINILCTVDVLNEGADMPFVECLLFLRPTESQRIFYQQLGRGLRKDFGKAFCTVIDFIGNFRNAYKIMEYQALSPMENEDSPLEIRERTFRDILNLPLGCEVHFEDSVVDIFARQLNDPRFATRHNIGRIMLYQYELLARRLRRLPTRKDVDRNLILNSGDYGRVFGSWARFQERAKESLEVLLLPRALG